MYVFLLYLHLLINVDIKDVCREMLESKRIVFDTKPLNYKLRGFSWIFKSINLCYNQCIVNNKKYEFLDADKRVYLHRELYFVNKRP